MIFELLDHEQEFLLFLDKLINETTEFEQKIQLVDKKLEFINRLIELEKYHLEYLLKANEKEDEHSLKRREQLDKYLLASRRDRDRDRDRDILN